jgi:hypothetical protein
MINHTRRKPKHRGCPLCISVDADANALLRAMAPNTKSFGRLISELIRREAERHTQRPAMLEALAQLAAQAGEG